MSWFEWTMVGAVAAAMFGWFGMMAHAKRLKLDRERYARALRFYANSGHLHGGNGRWREGVCPGWLRSPNEPTVIAEDGEIARNALRPLGVEP